jgi:hypothetical protein
MTGGVKVAPKWSGLVLIFDHGGAFLNREQHHGSRAFSKKSGPDQGPRESTNQVPGGDKQEHFLCKKHSPDVSASAPDA